MKAPPSLHINWLDLAPTKTVRLHGEIRYADGTLFASAGTVVKVRAVSMCSNAIMVTRADHTNIETTLQEMQKGTS